MPGKYKLRIKNFQSIKDQEIYLEGFTTLIGKSNRGKSAVVRALRVLFYNDWNSSFIRSGELECQISLEFVEPQTIKRISVFKSKDRNDYEIETSAGEIKKYPKVGKGVPDLFSSLNLEEITSERGDSYNLNFSSQFDEVFMLGKGEAATSSFVNKIFDIAKWEKALKAMRSDELQLLGEVDQKKQERQEIQVKQSDLSIQKNRVYSNLSELKGLLSSVTETSQQIESKKKGLILFSQVRKDQDILTLLTIFIRGLSNITKKFEEIYLGLSKKVSFLSWKKAQEFQELLNIQESAFKLFLGEESSVKNLSEILFKSKNLLSGLKQARVLSDQIQRQESFLVTLIRSFESLSEASHKIYQKLDIGSLEKRSKENEGILRYMISAVENSQIIKSDLLLSAGECPLCNQKIKKGKKK